MKWLLSFAIVMLIAFAFAPRSEIAPTRVALATWNDTPAQTVTPLPSPPLVFVPLEQLNPFPTLGAENTTRTPPRVSRRARAHFPKPNARHVSPDTLISIVFSAPMDAASVEKRFRVARTDNGAPVDGYFEWDKNMLVFYPTPLLESNARYRVLLRAGAFARSDKPLAEDLEWEFETGSF